MLVHLRPSWSGHPSNSAMPGDFTNATARHRVSLWSHEFGYELRPIIGELMQIVCLDADGCSRFLRSEFPPLSLARVKGVFTLPRLALPLFEPKISALRSAHSRARHDGLTAPGSSARTNRSGWRGSIDS